MPNAPKAIEIARFIFIAAHSSSLSRRGATEAKARTRAMCARVRVFATGGPCGATICGAVHDVRARLVAARLALRALRAAAHAARSSRPGSRKRASATALFAHAHGAIAGVDARQQSPEEDGSMHHHRCRECGIEFGCRRWRCDRGSRYCRVHFAAELEKAFKRARERRLNRRLRLVLDTARTAFSRGTRR